MPAILERMWQAVPSGWRDATQQQQQQQGSGEWDGTGTTAVTQRLGWLASPVPPPQQGQPAESTRLLTMSVRSCTKLQLRDSVRAQHEAQTQYARSALREGLHATGEAAAAAARTALQCSMARIWKLEWDNLEWDKLEWDRGHGRVSECASV